MFHSRLNLFLLIICSDESTLQRVACKSAPENRSHNEHQILHRFQNIQPFRRITDNVQDPPLLVLEYLDSNLLIEAGTKKLESSDVKLVAKVVLQALAALHEEGIVHTGTRSPFAAYRYKTHEPGWM